MWLREPHQHRSASVTPNAMPAFTSAKGAVSIVPRVRTNWPLVLSLLVVPVAALALWHWNNARLPSDDAADFASTGYEIFAKFRDQGLGAGLDAIFAVRGWRPTIFPVLLVPSLLACRGNLAQAVGLTQTLLYLGLTIYLYRLARRYVLPVRSALVVACTTTVPALRSEEHTSELQSRSE